MKRSVVCLAILAVILAGWPAVTMASPPVQDQGWWAEYYANPGLFDGAALTRYESNIDYNWGQGAPASGLPADRFSVRWTRTTQFNPGAYKFCVTIDDGARVWVDGHLIIDQWKVQSATTYCAEQQLSSGAHVVQMAYFENTGDAVAKLWWTPGGGPPQQPPPQQAGWNGQYFNNKDLSGSPALTRVDADLRFDWGTGSPGPGLPADNFSVRWTRDVSLPAGTYNFFAKHDDGVRLWVDGAPVIDFWYDQPATTHSGARSLAGGSHRVQVEYYEHTGFASIVVWWSVDGIEPPPGPGPSPGPDPAPGPGPSPGPGPAPGPRPSPGPDRRVVVDNSDAGFFWGGPLRSRNTAQEGVGNNLYWTYNGVIDPVNYGKWTPRLPGAGNYEVFVSIPPRFADSANVRYRILHNGQRHDRIVDQSRYSDQWVSLGTYYFNAGSGGSEFVLVYDNTREPLGSRMIAFDAVAFEPR